jgi:hypothetical protein
MAVDPLDVVTADRMQVRTMLFGALGCNLAWGIIDAGVFLMTRFNQRGRNAVQLRAVRAAARIGEAHRIIADALLPLLASVLPPDQLELMRQRLLQLPEPARPRLTKRDGFGAISLRNAVRVRLCVRTLRRVSTVGNGPLDGRHRCGAGRRCDRSGRLKAGLAPRTAVSAARWRVLPASLHLACAPLPRWRT